MRYIRKFRHGGIHLVSQSKRQIPEISNAFLPNHALLVFREKEDTPDPELIVNEGQQVIEGQLLAKGTKTGALNLHAPVPGLIRKVITVPSPDGFETKAIVLSMHGQFRITGKVTEHNYWHNLNGHEILYLLQDKGVTNTVTGEPVHELLAAIKTESVLVVNTVDIDAYPFHESEILNQHLRTILEGCQIIKKAAKINQVMFALNASVSRPMVTQLTAMAAKLELACSVEFFADKYPQFYPNQICQALKNVKPELPHVFIAPSTLFAVHAAVNDNRPHINQFVYLGGNALKSSRLLKARIGTPIGKLIEECGGFIGTPDLIAINNPFASGTVMDLDTPVSRSLRAVWALSKQQTRYARQENCIHCGSCNRVCPESLDPYHMYKLITVNRHAEIASQLNRCTTCGTCSSVCRSRIPLSITFRRQQKDQLL